MNSNYVCSNCRFESPFQLAGCPRCGRGTFSRTETVAPSYQTAAVLTPTGESRSCDKCCEETFQALDECPRCGGKLRTARQIRTLGFVLVFIGGFLVLLMGGVTIFVIGLISQAANEGRSSRIMEETTAFVAIFALFALVIMFGLVCIIGGVWQILFGRRNKYIKHIIIALTVLLFTVAAIVRIVL
jgi:rRNA maturation protein Nop10